MNKNKLKTLGVVSLATISTLSPVAVSAATTTAPAAGGTTQTQAQAPAKPAEHVPTQQELLQNLLKTTQNASTTGMASRHANEALKAAQADKNTTPEQLKALQDKAKAADQAYTQADKEANPNGHSLPADRVAPTLPTTKTNTPQTTQPPKTPNPKNNDTHKSTHHTNHSNSKTDNGGYGDGDKYAINGDGKTPGFSNDNYSNGTSTGTSTSNGASNDTSTNVVSTDNGNANKGARGAVNTNTSILSMLGLSSILGAVALKLKLRK